MKWNNAMGMSGQKLRDIMLVAMCMSVPNYPKWKGGEIDLRDVSDEIDRRLSIETEML